MKSSLFLVALGWATNTCLAAAENVFDRGLVPVLHSGNALDARSPDLQPIERGLSVGTTDKRSKTILKNSTTIAKSFDNALLFSMSETTSNNEASGNVSIICTTCYVKATATAQISIASGFNITQAIANFTGAVVGDVKNISSAAVAEIKGYVEDVGAEIFDDVMDDFDFSTFSLPSLNVSLDMTVPKVPDCMLQFAFDDLELYVELDVALSGTVASTVNLFTSDTPLGIEIGGQSLGVVFTMDLILSADCEIDISSGFHIQIDDGATLEIELFGGKISETTLKGGNFEFLPVQLAGASGVFSALLKLGAHAGFELTTPDVDILGLAELDASTGVQVSVYADVAEFTTNITASSDGDDSACELRVVEEYHLLVGAAAGATVRIDSDTWGPTPNTTIPIYATTLDNACATQTNPAASTTTSAASKLAARATTAASTSTAAAATSSPASTATPSQSLTTTTLTSTVTFTATVCSTPGLADCPSSLVSTIKTSTASTLVTAVPSGSSATFPPTTQASLTRTIAFGTAARKLFSTSGTPTSYAPGPTATGLVGEALDALSGKNKKVIIGSCVGGGAAAVAAIVGLIFWIRRRRAYKAVPGGGAAGPTDPALLVNVPYDSGESDGLWKPTPVIKVARH